MKKTVYTFSAGCLFLVGSMLSGCGSSAQKDSDSSEQAYFAQRSAEEFRPDSATAALNGVKPEEWLVFRSDSEKRLKDNDILLEDLKSRITNSGRKKDIIFAKWVYILEQDNKSLKQRMVHFEENQTDWKDFKHYFNQDMDKVSKALRDLKVGVAG